MSGIINNIKIINAQEKHLDDFLNLITISSSEYLNYAFTPNVFKALHNMFMKSKDLYFIKWLNFLN